MVTLRNLRLLAVAVLTCGLAGCLDLDERVRLSSDGAAHITLTALWDRSLYKTAEQKAQAERDCDADDPSDNIAVRHAHRWENRRLACEARLDTSDWKALNEMGFGGLKLQRLEGRRFRLEIDATGASEGTVVGLDAAFRGHNWSITLASGAITSSNGTISADGATVTWRRAFDQLVDPGVAAESKRMWAEGELPTS